MKVLWEPIAGLTPAAPRKSAHLHLATNSDRRERTALAFDVILPTPIPIKGASSRNSRSSGQLAKGRHCKSHPEPH